MSKNSYDIIYADPPWHYATRKTGTAFGGGVTDKYPTMKLADICELPIKYIAKANSILCIWTTMPYLMRTNQVIHAWGFEYVTCGWVWVKTNSKAGTIFKGVGNYTKHNAELCLIAKRGKGLPRQDRSIAQIVMSPRREHSRKPNAVKQDIERLWGKAERIELFARTTSPGWAVWGNETNKFKE